MKKVLLGLAVILGFGALSAYAQEEIPAESSLLVTVENGKANIRDTRYVPLRKGAGVVEVGVYGVFFKTYATINVPLTDNKIVVDVSKLIEKVPAGKKYKVCALKIVMGKHTSSLPGCSAVLVK